MNRFQTILALLLALMLSLTSVTMAVARGQATGGEAMVICSGYGVVTITLDEDGNPVGPVHLCPDCLAGLGLAVLPDAPTVQRPASRSAAVVAVARALPAGASLPLPKARGPPAAV
ncbi:hypothetical protein E7811_16585 [Aliigemmobacter aestuarii]|uniref:DUF2946 domain-containing protein n=1 Tax=Aliigemmobacter aestuarii TaxID=1445661 RepID=A0A4S3MKG7_9RHOB|nr:DUF2946 family protein [Gemmobacter aestuarii]THD81523.1 hypothetical protein E7811_16585 [Gemmobacter aestuarii]